ncbi:MAG: ATP-binding protein [Candidatus Thorarchaeota archaeon]
MDKTQLLWTLVEGTSELIFSVLKDGSIEYVNASFLTKLKYSEDNYEEVTFTDLAFPGSLNKVKELLKLAFSGKDILDQDFTLIDSAGGIVEVVGSLIPRYEGGLPVAVMGIFRDVTDQKRIEKEIQEARTKAEFLMDIMIHDITNINQEILSTLELVSFIPAFPPDMRSLLNECMTELERSTSIISNVRKLSVLESESQIMDDRDLGEAIYRASIRARALNPTKKLRLVNNVQLNTYYIRSNTYLSDVFYELFNNSLKFDEKDEVRVEVTANPIAHSPFLRVEISDYGQGISDIEKKRIFDKEVSRKDSVKGLGLGLTLVKRILESFGGYIRVEDRVQSDPSKGAKFVIMLKYSGEK